MLTSALSGRKQDKTGVLKMLIKRLHEGAKPEEIKKQFGDLIGNVTPADISQVEEELIKEGMPREEIRRLCDIHLAAFREILEKKKPLAPARHPVSILIKEHKKLLEFADELRNLSNEMKQSKDSGSVPEEMEHLKESERYHEREENVLFPPS